jgi:hypothetical protein
MLRESKSTNVDVALLVQSAQQQSPATLYEYEGPRYIKVSQCTFHPTHHQHHQAGHLESISNTHPIPNQNVPNTRSTSTQDALQHCLCLDHGRIYHCHSGNRQTRPLRLQRRLRLLHRKSLPIRELLQRHTQHMRSLLADRAILQSNCRLRQRHPMHRRCSTLFPHHRESWVSLWSLRL